MYSCLITAPPLLSPSTSRLLACLIQVPTLTQILLNDAEVERSAAAAHSSSLQEEEEQAWAGGQPGGAGGGGSGSAIGGGGAGGGGGVHDGGGDGGGAAAAAGGGPVYRSRRVAPGRLCPAPALLGGTVVDTDGRAVGGKGAVVLVSEGTAG